MERREGAHYYSRTVGGAAKTSFAPLGLPMKKTVKGVGLPPAGGTVSTIARPAATIREPRRATQKIVTRFWATVDLLAILPLAITLPLSLLTCTPDITRLGTLAGS